MFYLLHIVEEVSTFIGMVIKSPMRPICKTIGHDWRLYSGG
jgi:hypothetical protein